MRLRPSSAGQRTSLALALLLVACAAPHQNPPLPPSRNAAFGVDGAASREPGGGLAANGFELPKRRPADRHAGVEPLALPDAVVALIELTLTLTSSAGGRARERQEDIARGTDHVHIRSVDGDSEWLFIRNPLDPRRVSARRVDHRQRAIIEYDESELAMTGIARGWADVASIGVKRDALQRLSRTGKTESRFGFEFIEWRSVSGALDDAVWWSDEAALPLLVSGGNPRHVVQVTSLRRGVDRARFEEPRERFADYRVLDVADYREKHHETSDAAPARPRSGHLP